MVVDDDEGATIAGRTNDTPLGPPPVDGTIAMPCLNCLRHVTCIQITLAESIRCVFRPDKTNDLLCP
jgi:hypothetical protein